MFPSGPKITEKTPITYKYYISHKTVIKASKMCSDLKTKKLTLVQNNSSQNW